MTDTIIQRLDDAVFDKRGRAVTRLQARALSLKSVAPIQTTCGKFAAAVSLDGVQPITRMLITREDESGGRFSAPLWLNVKVSFTPVGRVSREVLEIPVEVRFPANPNHPWRSKAILPAPAGFVLVDTDGDRVADTYLPGTSNFIAGQSSRPELSRRPGLAVGGAMTESGYYVCHTDPSTGEQHCTFTCGGDYNCQIP